LILGRLQRRFALAAAAPGKHRPPHDEQQQRQSAQHLGNHHPHVEAQGF
jgi:hypothetical protein